MVESKAHLNMASMRLGKQLSWFLESRINLRMPGGGLGSQLVDVLRIVGSETTLPVMHIQHGSFDTHDDQPWRHARLLKDLGDNLAAFRFNLKSMGLWDQVVVMTYSEFGRRAAENGAEGTDHGTVSTRFVMGGRVKPSLYGEYPSLTELTNGDLRFNMDYRALYHAMSDYWMGDRSSD